ncbi:hypothetical protein, partial [Eubacterium callanderi]|uniref:hypothetical protein n=1 Tax=Eubacterium callanderi TaxID=53442 RepID=UPI00210CE478
VGTFTANFTRKPSITVSALNFNASAGRLSVNGIENSNAVNAESKVGTRARLKATPKAGYKFVSYRQPPLKKYHKKTGRIVRFKFP